MIIDDDAFRIGKEGAVAVLSVADVAVIVDDDGAVLAAALVFAAAGVIVGETPEIGITVFAHLDAFSVGGATVAFVNNIDGFADIAFHAGSRLVQAADRQTRPARSAVRTKEMDIAFFLRVKKVRDNKERK